jgi:hypothetical protein
VAIDSVSGRLRIVVDSVVLTDRVFVELQEQAETRPANLNKMYFGQYGTGLSILKFTNLQVYSSLLSTEQLLELTRAGSEQCAQGKGDYLNWEDTQWTLTGGAVWETMFLDEPCAPVSILHLYAQAATMLADAVHHCGKVGGRIPPVTTLQDFKDFEEQVWGIAFDRLTTMDFFSEYTNVVFGGPGSSRGIWTPISDQEAEGMWMDVYSCKYMKEKYTDCTGEDRTSGTCSNNPYIRRDTSQ